MKFNGQEIPKELRIKYQEEFSELQDYEYRKRKEEEA